MNKRKLLARSRTNWRRVISTLVVCSATSLGLYLGFTTRSDTRTVVREREVAGPPCFEIKTGPDKGRPSKGCERLAELLALTCANQPRYCAQAVARAVVNAQPEVRRELAAAVDRALTAPVPPPPSSEGGDRKPEAKDEGGSGAVPDADDKPTASLPKAPGSSTPTPANPVPAPPASTTPRTTQRPSPSDTVNDAVDRVQTTANDITDSVGGGRPVPDLPDLAPTPTLPDLVPDVPALPSVCVPTPLTPCPNFEGKSTTTPEPVPDAPPAP